MSNILIEEQVLVKLYVKPSEKNAYDISNHSNLAESWVKSNCLSIINFDFNSDWFFKVIINGDTNSAKAFFKSFIEQMKKETGFAPVARIEVPTIIFSHGKTTTA